MLSPQVVIVGAGPCGLAAVLVPRNNRIAVRLIEDALDYQIGVRQWNLTNTLLQPKILELFKILGLLADIFDNSIEPSPNGSV
ncbi:hypothetical protein BS47DRAFT_829253 [Hydnum rufescens UP504]|uniref:FAD-binding domain-containing protein n=1 Tax=Hydnum rufescens UP504 TaxID=1448309 RepID=A0A9P6AZU9_9AGAM|nr:hypothetical protein BS47DRAFT_829253 [Hydnum rufescens UP504]